VENPAPFTFVKVTVSVCLLCATLQH